MIQGYESPENFLWDDEKRAQAGQAIESLTEHPGWEPLMEVLDSYRTGIRIQLESKTGEVPATEYASQIGESRGVGKIRALAVEAVRVGQKAAENLKETQQV
jgi:hypothetical protein